MHSEEDHAKLDADFEALKRAYANLYERLEIDMLEQLAGLMEGLELRIFCTRAMKQGCGQLAIYLQEKINKSIYQ